MSVHLAYDADEIALAASQRRAPLRAALAASVTLSRCLEGERPRLARGFRLTVPPEPEPLVRGLPVATGAKPATPRRVILSSYCTTGSTGPTE